MPPAERPSPWEFRFRAFISFLAYGIAFFAGFLVSSVLGWPTSPTFYLAGEHWGTTGVHVAATVAAAFTFAGFLLRWWGSSYHGAGVVFGRGIETATLTAAGPYRYTRNPLYLGNILQAIGIGSLGPPLATALVVILITAFVYRLVFLEERYLREAQGESYLRYCAAVPRMFPRLGNSSLPPSDQRPNVAYGFVTELGFFGFLLMMIYLAINPYGPIAIFWGFFYVAIALFIIGGIANRRLYRTDPDAGAPSSKLS